MLLQIYLGLLWKRIYNLYKRRQNLKESDVARVHQKKTEKQILHVIRANYQFVMNVL